MRYSFGVREKSPRKPEFSWNFLDWEECNANCGPGEQISKPRCLEKHAGLVDDTFCKSMARPQEKVRPCYRAPCVPRLVHLLSSFHSKIVEDPERSLFVPCNYVLRDSRIEIKLLQDVVIKTIK